MGTTDWRAYEMMTGENWRQGDEPEIYLAVYIEHGDKKVTIPLPKGAIIRIVPNEKPKEKPDPNEDKYTCAPYGVPKCADCLKPHDYCFCKR